MGDNYRSVLKKGAVAAEGWPWSSGKTPLKDALCLDAQPCPLDVCTVRSPNNNFNNNGLTGKRYLPTSRRSMAETLPCMPRAQLWRDVEQLSTRCLQCDVRPSRRMNSRHPGDERAQTESGDTIKSSRCWRALCSSILACLPVICLPSAPNHRHWGHFRSEGEGAAWLL